MHGVCLYVYIALMFYVIGEMTEFQICIHSSQKVRKGLVNAVRGLLLNCRDTLGESRLMFLVSSKLVKWKLIVLGFCPQHVFLVDIKRIFLLIWSPHLFSPSFLISILLIM